ncbi:MAG: hypothetical protein IT178_16190 [Acidobacteria bacterium]|nr:hypothetical protein [Acidobacteriota bacterium]
MVLVALVAIGKPMAAQSRLAVKGFDNFTASGATWLFELPAHNEIWSGPLDIVNAEFTGTGRYLVDVRTIWSEPGQPLQLWVGDVTDGRVWTLALPTYVGGLVIPARGSEQVYVWLVKAGVPGGELVAFTPGTPLTLADLRQIGVCATRPVVSRNGARGLCRRDSQTLLIVDTASGTTLAAHDVPELWMATDDTGSTLVSLGSEITEYDAITGAIRRSVLSPSAEERSRTPTAIGPRRERSCST